MNAPVAQRIYLAQHGLAVDKTENPERPLSEAGIQQSEAIAKHLHATGVSVSQIFHSGKLRARQTAEIFASTLNINTLSTSDQLSPNDDVTQTTSLLDIDNALYIGHLPHLEKLVSFLITGDTETNIIKFQNSAVACLEKANDEFSIKWYLTPALFRTSPA